MRSETLGWRPPAALVNPVIWQTLDRCGGATRASRGLGVAGLGDVTCAELSAAIPSLSRPLLPASALPTIVAAQASEPRPLRQVLKEAGAKALGGGLPGAAAMAVQVLSLMWMRTTINYQYRYGTSTSVALKTLYGQGGIPRFYRGLLPALLQGPLSRFGDTAANTGTLSLLQSFESTRALPMGVQTLAASASAGLFRIALMPIDTVKTIMQVEGQGGFSALVAKVRAGGPRVLFHGALAASAATFVGHYPWFAMYNTLDAKLPKYEGDLPKRLLRAAFMGWCSSLVSDTVSNSIRVIKTTKQTSKVALTYRQALTLVLEQDGLLGLLGRGLKTKLIANGMQGIMFSVFWRLGQDWWAKKAAAEAAAAAAS